MIEREDDLFDMFVMTEICVSLQGTHTTVGSRRPKALFSLNIELHFPCGEDRKFPEDRHGRQVYPSQMTIQILSTSGR